MYDNTVNQSVLVMCTLNQYDSLYFAPVLPGLLYKLHIVCGSCIYANSKCKYVAYLT